VAGDANRWRVALVWSIHPFAACACAVNWPEFAILFLSHHHARRLYFRATISAAPFMLPLMFQVGFGMSAFEAGSLAVFAGNLAMKPATTPLIRRFGFKNC
jgi:hypothetical protein